jgi:hypothetical protein
MHDDRNVVVREIGSGPNPVVIGVLVAALIVLAGAFLYWHPWSTSSTTNTTTVTQPANGANAANGSSTQNSSSTTTTNGQPQPQST